MKKFRELANLARLSWLSVGKGGGFDGVSNTTKFRYFSLPNVSRVDIIKNNVNTLLHLFGIQTYADGRKVELYPLDLSSTNDKYLAAMERRLIKLRDKRDPKYFEVAYFLGCRSRLFFIWALRSININWARDFPEKKIKGLAKSYFKIWNGLEHKVEFRRVWIQSPAGKERGLSVPTMRWRVAGAMISRLTEIWVEPVYDPRQHAYISRRGSGTAWRALFRWLWKVPNLCEIDLKNCFPSINHGMIQHALREIGVATFWANWLVCQISQPSEEPTSLEVPDPLDSSTPVIVHANIEELLYHKNEPEFGSWYRLEGVAMGYPVSPMLATLVFQQAMQSFEKVMKEKFSNIIEFILYADDAVIGWYNNKINYEEFTWELEKMLDFYGITLNIGKSRSLRTEGGVWLTPFKFLGLWYDPVTDLLSSRTRKGASLSLDVTTLFSLAEGLVGRFFLNSVKVYTGYALGVPVPAEVGDLKKFRGGTEFPSSVAGMFTIWPRAADWVTGYKYKWGKLYSMCSTGYWVLKKALFSLVTEWTESGVRTAIEDHALAKMILHWRNVVYTRYWGIILSRLYIGRWNVNMKQNFRLMYKESSFLYQMVSADRERFTVQVPEGYSLRQFYNKEHLDSLGQSSDVWWRQVSILTIFNATSYTIMELRDKMSKWNIRPKRNRNKKMWLSEATSPPSPKKLKEGIYFGSHFEYTMRDHLFTMWEKTNNSRNNMSACVTETEFMKLFDGEPYATVDVPKDQSINQDYASSLLKNLGGIFPYDETLRQKDIIVKWSGAFLRQGCVPQMAKLRGPPKTKDTKLLIERSLVDEVTTHVW